MPELKMIQADLSDRGALAHLESVMLAPDDAELRWDIEEWGRLKIIFALLDGGQFPITPTDAAALGNRALSVRPMRMLKETTERRLMYGGIAAEILARLFEARDRGLQEAITHARADIANRLGPAGKIGASTIRDFWPKWRAVAHLWLARRTIMKTYADETFPCAIERLAVFLAIAELHRKAGEQLELPGGSGDATALYAAETWRAPASLVLPTVTLAPRQPVQSTL